MSDRENIQEILDRAWEVKVENTRLREEHIELRNKITSLTAQLDFTKLHKLEDIQEKLSEIAEIKEILKETLEKLDGV